MFLYVERSNELLDLIHNNICDMKSTPTRGGTRYFVKLIDDWSKYYYEYLLYSKDETFNVFKDFKVEVENQLQEKKRFLDQL